MRHLQTLKLTRTRIRFRFVSGQKRTRVLPELFALLTERAARSPPEIQT
ncbi:hypothetical protein J2W79_000693 [Methylorubrum extorquens]|nr:hypothetical protein [Methylorubrum extorquens]